MSPPAAFKSVEMFDREALRMIVSNWEIVQLDPSHRADWIVSNKTYSPLSILNNYLAKSRVDASKPYATFNVIYYYSGNSVKEGRMYAMNGCGLQSFARPIRHTLAHKFYEDIDMCNAHPTILLQYCVRKGYETSHIRDYVENRDERLEELIQGNSNISREDAKRVVLAIMNGGTADYNALNNKPIWLTNMKHQLEIVQRLIASDKENERFFKRAKKDNVLGSTMNHLLCYLENEILMASIEYLKRKGISTSNVVLVFDGFMIPKGACRVNEEFLTGLSEFVKEKTNYSIKFVVKPMDEVMQLEGLTLSEVVNNEMTVVATDKDAAEVFVSKHEDVVKKSEGRIFVYGKNNTWTCEGVDRLLLDKCMDTKIYKSSDTGRIFPFSENVKGAKSIIEASKEKIKETPGFSKMLWRKSIGKLYFSDGYYDFTKQEFVKSVEPEDSYTTIRLSYEFPARDEAKIAEVRQRLFGSIMLNDEMTETYLAHIARGIAGYYEDKDWCVGIGERNSGKGVCVGLNENTFEGYCATLNSDSFLMERNSDGDAAKKLSWALDCEFKRLLFTNEITMDGKHKRLNGNLIKKLASGGDTMKARKNYCDEVEFKIQGRLFMFCNDLPPITPADAGETMNVFNFPYQFVETPNPEMSYQKHRDETIKRYCEEQEVRNAYLHLVLDAFKMHRVEPCDAVRKETAIFRAEAGDETSMLREAFEFTKNDEDRMASKDIMDWAKDEGLNISAQKMRQRLEKLGVVYKEAMRLDGKLVKGYSGLRKIDEDE